MEPQTCYDPLNRTFSLGAIVTARLTGRRLCGACAGDGA